MADNTPPDNSNINADPVTDTTAKINFDTNVPGVNTIEFGETTAYGQQVNIDASALISNVSATPVNDTTERIEWYLSEFATGQVEYGITVNYGSFSIKEISFNYDHHIQQISGLTPGALYHFRVISQDQSGNISYSDDYTFTASGTPGTGPVISNVLPGSITSNSAIISWDVSENSTGQVEYGPTTAYGNFSTADTTFNNSHHDQTISGLQPGTLYHFRVYSQNSAGVMSVSADYTFATDGIGQIQWVASGPFVGGVGAINAAFPVGGYQNNDLAILLVETANELVATPAGWTLHANGMIGQGVAAAIDAVRLTAFYKICSDVEADVALADSGDHTAAIIHIIRAIDAADPIESIVQSTTLDTAPDKIFHFGDIVTQGINRLILYAMATATSDQISDNVVWDTGLVKRSDNGLSTVSPKLVGSVTTPTGNQDLTALGIADWAQWGYTDTTSFNHKAGPNKINNFSVIGSATVARFAAYPFGFSWTDGTPNATVTNTTTGVYVTGLNNGFRITVQADIKEREFRIYAKIHDAILKIQSALSDASAADYIDASVSDTGNSTDILLIALTYKAASNGQSLTVDLIIDTVNAGIGDVAILAATLTETDNSGGGISAATLAVPDAGSVGDKTGYEITRNNVALLGIVLKPYQIATAISLAGAAEIAGTAAADLGAEGELSGAAQAEASSTADLQSTVGLSGAAAAAAAADAAISLETDSALRGSAKGEATATADAGVAVPMSGDAEATTTALGNLWFADAHTSTFVVQAQRKTYTMSAA